MEEAASISIKSYLQAYVEQYTPFWSNIGKTVTNCSPEVNFVLHMSKIKFVKHPRSIVQKRQDHPSTLSVTIPKKIVNDWTLHVGQIVEFTVLVEGQDVFLKLAKVHP